MSSGLNKTYQVELFLEELIRDSDKDVMDLDLPQLKTIIMFNQRYVGIYEYLCGNLGSAVVNRALSDWLNKKIEKTRYLRTSQQHNPIFQNVYRPPAVDQRFMMEYRPFPIFTNYEPQASFVVSPAIKPMF